MSDIKKLLGKKIKLIRKERKLTQEQLAELVDIGTPNISYIENGKFAPSNETLQKIAKALDVSPSELYNFDEFKNVNDIKKELFDALDKDDKVLKVIYGVFKSLRFHVK